MALDATGVGAQLHMLVFCKLTITPVEGPNAGKPFVVTTRTAYSQKGDRDAVRLKGPQGETLGVGPGDTEPDWEIECELGEANRLAKHIAPPEGAGLSFVHFTFTATHQKPGAAKITDVMQNCLLLQDGREGKSGDNTTVKLAGPGTTWLPGGVNPNDFTAVFASAG